MFLFFSGSNIGGPKWYTNMASLYKALQKSEKHFGKELSNCGLQRPEIWTMVSLYISLLQHFIFLASSTGQFPIYFFVLCLLHDSENNLYNLFYTVKKHRLSCDQFALTYGNRLFEGMNDNFFMKFGKYTKSILMKRSLFDQRLEWP